MRFSLSPLLAALLVPVISTSLLAQDDAAAAPAAAENAPAPAPAAAVILANGDFSQGLEGWKVAFREEVEAKHEVVPDANEGLPALKIEVAYGDWTQWYGSVSAPLLNLKPDTTYTITAILKVEPDDAPIDIMVFGRNPGDKNVTQLGERFTPKPTQAFEEFSTTFTTPAKVHESMTLNFAQVTHPGTTVWISNVRVAEE